MKTTLISLLVSIVAGVIVFWFVPAFSEVKTTTVSFLNQANSLILLFLNLNELKNWQIFLFLIVAMLIGFIIGWDRSSTYEKKNTFLHYTSDILLGLDAEWDWKPSTNINSLISYLNHEPCNFRFKCLRCGAELHTIKNYSPIMCKANCGWKWSIPNKLRNDNLAFKPEKLFEAVSREIVKNVVSNNLRKWIRRQLIFFKHKITLQ